MDVKNILEINPVLLVTLIGALGLKDILWEWIKRCWLKSDEKEKDHKIVEEMNAELKELKEQVKELKEQVAEILKIQKAIQDNTKRSDENDLILMGREILDLQNRAIAKEKVSSTCMPDYLEAVEHYYDLARKTGGKISERVKLNHEIILEMVKNGQVVETLKEWYK